MDLFAKAPSATASKKLTRPSVNNNLKREYKYTCVGADPPLFHAEFGLILYHTCLSFPGIFISEQIIGSVLSFFVLESKYFASVDFFFYKFTLEFSQEYSG